MGRLLGLLESWQAATSDVTRCRLHVVRFARMTESLRLQSALCDDASDKLDGDWILDRSYVAAFIQGSLARAREIVFDAGVLTGESCEDLDARLDSLRAEMGRLTTEPERGDPGDVGAEEPEYRMLRNAIRRLSPQRGAGPSSDAGPASTPGLTDVLQDAVERAMASFGGLHLKSWGRRTGTPVAGSGLPCPVRVVDTGEGLAAPGGRARPLTRADLRGPVLALVEPLDPAAGPRTADPGGGALGIVGRDRATVSVERPGQGVLIDASLPGLDEGNLVWCGFRSSSRRPVAPVARVLAERGFRRLDSGRVVTGWLTGRGEGQTREALGHLGGAVAEWLRGTGDEPPSVEASRAPTGAVNRWASGGWGA